MINLQWRWDLLRSPAWIGDKNAYVDGYDGDDDTGERQGCEFADEFYSDEYTKNHQ